MTITTRIARKLTILTVGTIIGIAAYNLVGMGIIGDLVCLPIFLYTLYLMEK